MKKDGKIVRWDEARAFGFIRSPNTPADIFFHIKDFRGAAAPQQGMAVTFEEIHVGGKGPRAMAVQAALPFSGSAGAPSFAGTAGPSRSRHTAPPHDHGRAPNRRAPPAPARPAWPWLLLIGGWLSMLAWAIWAGRLAPIALPLALGLNLATFLAYWIDKRAAQAGQWRIAENTLHLLGLLGGWPGAWLGQQVLRHKSSKASFRAMYWATVMVHCLALLGFLFWPQLQILLLNK